VSDLHHSNAEYPDEVNDGAFTAVIPDSLNSQLENFVHCDKSIFVKLEHPLNALSGGLLLALVNKSNSGNV